MGSKREKINYELDSGLKSLYNPISPFKGYKDFTIGYYSYTLSWLAEILELRKGLIIWGA